MHDFAFENRSYLGQFEAEFKKALARESGARGYCLMKKTGGRKSRDTVPLNTCKLYTHYDPILKLMETILLGIYTAQYRFYCTVGSSDFGTLTYFKQIWIAVKILRSNYKIRFSLYLAISCENGIFGSKKVGSSLYKGRHFFYWNRSIWVSKEPYFHADFKNVNIP
jgi:hypothetical protein